MRVLRERLIVSQCVSFPFGFDCRMLDMIASVPGYCFSFYFTVNSHVHIKLLIFSCKENHKQKSRESKLTLPITYG